MSYLKDEKEYSNGLINKNISIIDENEDADYIINEIDSNIICEIFEKVKSGYEEINLGCNLFSKGGIFVDKQRDF